MSKYKFQINERPEEKEISESKDFEKLIVRYRVSGGFRRRVLRRKSNFRKLRMIILLMLMALAILVMFSD